MFDRRARMALIILCATLVSSAAGFYAAVGALKVYLHKEPVEVRKHFSTIPQRLGSWSSIGGDAVYAAEMVEELGTSIYLDRTYRQEGAGADEWLGVHIAYYTGMIDAVPHVPDRCMVAGGFDIQRMPRNLPLDLDTSRWRPDPVEVHAATAGEPFPTVMILDSMTRSARIVRLPVGDFALRTTAFGTPDAEDATVYAGYFFVANGRIAVSPDEVRLFAFRPSEKYAYYCKVQFTAAGDRGFTEEAFLDRCSRFLNVLLPELMSCLPDWAEVQKRDVEASAAE